MDKEISPIINARDLLLLKQHSEIIIIDARTGDDAKNNYAAKHLKDAFYVDLNRELADIKPDLSMGGRHPLPSPAHFSKFLNRTGITPNSHIIIYDDKYGSNAAARLWWMLKAIKHTKVQVLDGGLNAAVDAGFPISSSSEIPLLRVPYNPINWMLPLVNIDEVDKAAKDEKFLIIDVRDTERFIGEKEPIDLIAGHIPGAVNIPFTQNLDAKGFFLSPEILKEKYLKAFNKRDIEKIIVHCGSGITACHTLIAIAHAGLKIPNLYVGSWSEWSRNNRPMATMQGII